MVAVIERVLLQPLSYAHSSRLAFIGPSSRKAGFGATSWQNYRDIRDQSKLLKDAAGYSEDVGVVEGPDGSRSVPTPRLTVNSFSMLGVRPLLGRAFIPADGQSNGPAVVLLSEGMWRQSFHANPNVVGLVINVNGKPHTVIGVMPESFHFPEAMGPDLQRGVWLPVQPTGEMQKNRGYQFFNMVGELRPGVSIAQFQQELNAIAARIQKIDGGNTIAFHAVPYGQVLIATVEPTLYALLGALALVLLIGCANVANLLIARTLSRQQEFALRAALGASRMRLVRQMLCEGLTLSLFGCGIGALIAEAIVAVARNLPEGIVPRADTISIHWTVVLVLAVIATVSGVLSSLFPALLVVRTHPQTALQSAARGVSLHSVKGRLSRWLVVGEVALSTLLLVGTGLLFHTLWNLEKAHLGFAAANLTTFTAMPPDAAGLSNMLVPADTQIAPASVATITYEPVLNRIRHLPDVASAALITTRPLSSSGIKTNFEIVGQPTSSRDQAALISAVSGDYARTMDTPVLRGRMADDDDVASTPFVAVVNEALARNYFPGINPIGKQINLGGMDKAMAKPYTIVGVLADQIQGKVGGQVQPVILFPQQQIPTTSLFYQALLKTEVCFVVKTRGNIPIAAEVRTVFHQAASDFALSGFQTMQEAIDRSTFSHRLGFYLVSSFAGLAVAMVFAGLYGVLTQLVGYRRHEIGVRMALGATRGSVAQLILRDGALLIVSGLGVGMLVALGMGHWLTSFLYRMQPLDPPTYAAVAIALAAIGLVASVLPARRAASIEPIQALREE